MKVNISYIDPMRFIPTDLNGVWSIILRPKDLLTDVYRSYRVVLPLQLLQGVHRVGSNFANILANFPNKKLFTLPETNIFAPENGWLEDDPFLLGSFWGPAYLQGLRYF